MAQLNNVVIGIKGGGDIASGVAMRLYRSGLKNIFIMEIERPMAVRRTVSFCEAVYTGEYTVESVTSRHVSSVDEIQACWLQGEIPVVVDPAWEMISSLKPNVVVDAIIAKRNLGTDTTEADVVMALGPGFTAGKDVHCIIETNRGHRLGRTIYSGTALENTGLPESVNGYRAERVVRAPIAGDWHTECHIGQPVCAGDEIARVADLPVYAEIKGVIRGLLRNGTPVKKGTKAADIDPRGDAGYCTQISDKALAVGGGVLEAILYHYTK